MSGNGIVIVSWSTVGRLKPALLIKSPTSLYSMKHKISNMSRKLKNGVAAAASPNAGKWRYVWLYASDALHIRPENRQAKENTVSVKCRETVQQRKQIRTSQKPIAILAMSLLSMQKSIKFSLSERPPGCIPPSMAAIKAPSGLSAL